MGAGRRPAAGARRAGRRGGARRSSRPNTAKADETVLSGLRERIGLDQLDAVNVGAAPTPARGARVLPLDGSAGLAELWGLSETCAAGACNPRVRVKIGRSARPLPGVELRLADDGEVLLRGPVVMAGYRNDPGEDRGDDRRRGMAAHRRRRRAGRGRLPADHRPQEGADHQLGWEKHVAGQHRVEAEGGQPADRPGLGGRRRSPLQRRPDRPRSRRRAGLRRRARDRATARSSRSQPTRRSSRRSSRRWSAATPMLARVEQVKKFKLLGDDWQPGGVELTPTMKLRRRPIEHRYGPEIEALYR